MLVWYVAYGSNLLGDRFVTYLRGGTVPGSGRLQGGARDAADPRDTRPYRLDQPLIFAQRSRSWRGGGVCFIDPDRPTAGATAGRAWLLTVEQFSDVWSQENGTEVGVDLDIEALMAVGSMEVGTGWYRRLLWLGEFDGHPVVTFTCASATNLNPGDSSYLGVVGRGLMETWSWSAEEAAHYLVRAPGNAGALDIGSLTSLFASDPRA